MELKLGKGRWLKHQDGGMCFLGLGLQPFFFKTFFLLFFGGGGLPELNFGVGLGNKNSEIF